MLGRKIGIVTMGGSWGVALSDSLEEKGLFVPELSWKIQKTLKDLGFPDRASVRNPVDAGASGLYYSIETMAAVGREILHSGEVDALILHGVGRPGILNDDSPKTHRAFVEIEKKIIKHYVSLEQETGKPVLICSQHPPSESQVLNDCAKERIRIYNSLQDTAHLLNLMAEYEEKRGSSD